MEIRSDKLDYHLKKSQANCFQDYIKSKHLSWQIRWCKIWRRCLPFEPDCLSSEERADHLKYLKSRSNLQQKHINYEAFKQQKNLTNFRDISAKTASEGSEESKQFLNIQNELLAVLAPINIRTCSRIISFHLHCFEDHYGKQRFSNFFFQNYFLPIPIQVQKEIIRFESPNKRLR